MSVDKYEAPLNDVSEKRPNLFLLGLIRLGTFLYFCFMTLMLLHPHPWALLGFEPRGGIAHSAFSVIHLLIFMALAVGVELGRNQRPVRFWLILLLLYSATTELLQMMTGRSFEWIDIAQDTAGVLLGLMIAVPLHKTSFVRRRLPF